MSLFVGGLRDGDWINVPDNRESWTMQERTRLSAANFDPNAPVEPVLIRQETYQRMRFQGLKETYTVYGGASLTPDDVLKRLIEGYKP